MKRNQYKPYIAAGLTAFLVVAASICLAFLIFHPAAIQNFLHMLSYILRPIFIGMVIAFLLLPVHRNILRFLLWAVSRVTKREQQVTPILNAVSILLSLLCACVLVYLILAMLIPQVYLSIVGLVNAFPGYILRMQEWLQTFLEDNPDIQATVMPLYDSAANALEQWLRADILPNLESATSTIRWLKEFILPNFTDMVTNVSAMVLAFVNLMKDLLVALIVSVYLLARKDIFAAQSKKVVYSIFPARYGDLIVEETRNAYRIMSGFINGKLVDSLIIGVITLVCCNLFRFPYPVLVATIVGVTNVIPFFGPFIGGIPCAILILFVSPIKCVYFVIFIVILQQFDGNILGPKILGESTGLASFWILFSILLFGGLFGFAGMVLGVPVFAMIYSILKRMVHRGLRHHALPVETEYYMGVTGPMENREKASDHDNET